MKKHILTAALALAASTAAMAGPFYAGVGLQNVQLDAPSNSAAVQDRSGNGLRLTAGYQLDKTWSVEGFYAHTSGMALTSSAKGHETGLAVVGQYPLTQKLSAVGKVGVSHTRLDAGAQDFTNNSMLVGAGVSYALAKDLRVRTEWEHTRDFADSGEAMNKVAVTLIKSF